MMARPALTFQKGTNIEYKTQFLNSRGKVGAPWSDSSRAVIFITEQLLQAILGALQLDEGAILSGRAMPWSSATFDGMRYTWVLLAADAEGQRRAKQFCKLAAERDWPLKGAFVADFSGCLCDSRLTVEVLTVMER